MNRILIILNIISFLAAFVWLIVERSWESFITFIGLLGTLITLLFTRDNSGESIKMKQKGGKKSNNYQTGGDININN